MNLVTLLARSTAGAALASVLVTGCGNGDTTAPQGNAPAAVPASQVPYLPPVSAPRPNCPLSADQAERASTTRIAPECLRSRQRAAQQEYRQLTRTHTFGHQ